MQGTESLYIQHFHVTEDYVAIEERIDGLDQVRIINRAGESTHVEFPEDAYTAYIQFDPEFDEDILRLSYTSMTTPWTDYDYHIDSDELDERKVQEIPSGYDASQFVTNRELATARDGVQVPVSIVRHKDTPVDGSAPLYIYAYGAYGSGISRTFPPPGCRCWNGVSYSPSPTYAAATSWDTTGTRPANWTGAPTRSTISSTWPAT